MFGFFFFLISIFFYLCTHGESKRNSRHVDNEQNLAEVVQFDKDMKGNNERK